MPNERLSSLYVYRDRLAKAESAQDEVVGALVLLLDAYRKGNAKWETAHKVLDTLVDKRRVVNNYRKFLRELRENSNG